MLSKNEIYIVTSDNLYVLQEGNGIDSVWKNNEKANKRADILNEAAGEELWNVEGFRVSV